MIIARRTQPQVMGLYATHKGCELIHELPKEYDIGGRPIRMLDQILGRHHMYI